MSDPVTTVAIGVDWGTLASVGFAFTAIGSFGTWLWNRGGRAALLAQSVKASADELKAANERTDKVQVAYDKLLEELHNHMLADAASFAKLEQIAATAANATIAAEARLTGAMEKLGDRIDKMSDRFDVLMNSRVNFLAAIDDRAKHTADTAATAG
jgi:hypothetical protein